MNKQKEKSIHKNQEAEPSLPEQICKFMLLPFFLMLIVGLLLKF